LSAVVIRAIRGLINKEASMSRITKVTCDTCANDLTWSSNCVDWRLALVNESVPHQSEFVTMAGCYPAIKNNVHFCGIDCLRKWFDEHYPKQDKPYHGGKFGAAYWRKQQFESSQKEVT
jgi:hypothetical protein